MLFPVQVEVLIDRLLLVIAILQFPAGGRGHHAQGNSRMDGVVLAQVLRYGDSRDFRRQGGMPSAEAAASSAALRVSGLQDGSCLRLPAGQSTLQLRVIDWPGAHKNFKLTLLLFDRIGTGNIHVRACWASWQMTFRFAWVSQIC